jgi:hypothetical protein
MSAIAKIAKNRNIYRCENCYYSTCNLFDFNKHTQTKKHTQSGQSMAIDDFSMVCEQKSHKKEYICVKCNKVYKDNSGLWKHKKTCCKESIIPTTQLNELNKDELIISLLKQNAELIKGQQDMFVKLTENGINNHSNNTTTNCNNKAFNLQFFLNETCKNAMNITDFIDSIKLQLNDLMEVGEIGYVDGISKIIVNNLNNLDETERPIHCTDKKRETMYIKDDDKWEKEDDNKTKLKKAINRIADKNIKLLPQFREKYPNYNNSSSKMSDKYDKLVIEVMETDDYKKEKIIKNISNATTIK